MQDFKKMQFIYWVLNFASSCQVVFCDKQIINRQNSDLNLYV